jgi:Uma2 family endonuclease
MRESRAQDKPILISDYLRAEEDRETRYEYVRGQIYAMSGGTLRHAQIAANIIARLGAASRGTPCRVFTSDANVQPTDDVVYYPDVSVACGANAGSSMVITSPCLVVEVTSRNTMRVDRGEKVDEYCKSASLKGYLIVDQNVRRVTYYVRDAEGAWIKSEFVDSGSVAVPCPRLALTLEQIYEDVALPPLGVAEPEWDEEAGSYVGSSD